MNQLVNFCLVTSTLFGFCHAAATKIYTDVREVTLLENETHIMTFKADKAIPGVRASVVGNHGGVVDVDPLTIDLSSPPPWNVTLRGIHRGHDTVYMNLTTSDNNVNVDSAYVVVTVERSRDLELASTIVGWVYFVAWSVSFYPQCYENWLRKSVVGLNFDFLALNLIGFILYSLFNCGLYWGSGIQKEYFAEHPRGLNPVLLNDVVFSLHAVFITLITICQCFIYESGGQRVSKIATGIISILLLIFAVSFVLPFFTVINWLMFLYICSYIKLSITLMKYVPQAFMNYKRKSTIGWSIGNVILDFTGGMLSMMQMMVNADNYDDWNSIFGDPTKFGLGLFSVLFDILFLVQHYILYRNVGYEELPGDVIDESSSSATTSTAAAGSETDREPAFVGEREVEEQYGQTKQIESTLEPLMPDVVPESEAVQ